MRREILARRYRGDTVTRKVSDGSIFRREIRFAAFLCMDHLSIIRGRWLAPPKLDERRIFLENRKKLSRSLNVRRIRALGRDGFDQRVIDTAARAWNQSSTLVEREISMVTMQRPNGRDTYPRAAQLFPSVESITVVIGTSPRHATTVRVAAVESEVSRGRRKNH